ncbi:lipoate--protein ligase family protein [Candidatus Woesearchaeota archaeon]|nr:lipoate--protein ligase family protein [Candidatus Woesearchaeota archaeon]
MDLENNGLKCRILSIERKNAFMNMAIDEAMMDYVKNTGEAVMRVYFWNGGGISLGYRQPISTINLKECNALNLKFVRRITGGKNLYHSPNDITYAVALPEKNMPPTVSETYKIICGWIIEGLKNVGVNAELAEVGDMKKNVGAACAADLSSPHNDVVVDGKKICGNAQIRKGGVVMQHGSIFYNINKEIMAKVLNVEEGLIKKNMASVDSLCSATPKEVANALLESFIKNSPSCYQENLSREEMRNAKKLEMLYKADQWNFEGKRD